jgi:hypothetical protein
MILGGWTAGVWILMEKKAFRCNFAKIRKIPEKYGNILFYLRTKEARRRSEGGAGAPHPIGAGPPEAMPRAGVAHLPGLRLRPFAYIFPTEP